MHRCTPPWSSAWSAPTLSGAITCPSAHPIVQIVADRCRWNTARCLADFLLRHPRLARTKRVLEFGAGAGLPSLLAVLQGAGGVVCTDYPDRDLVDNIRYNVGVNLPDAAGSLVDVQVG